MTTELVTVFANETVNIIDFQIKITHFTIFKTHN